MFAVSFYDEIQGVTMWGDGETPQEAWDNLIDDNGLDEEDLDDQNMVTWYRSTDTVVPRPAKLEWVDGEDLED